MIKWADSTTESFSGSTSQKKIRISFGNCSEAGPFRLTESDCGQLLSIVNSCCVSERGWALKCPLNRESIDDKAFRDKINGEKGSEGWVSRMFYKRRQDGRGSRAPCGGSFRDMAAADPADFSKRFDLPQAAKKRRP